MVVGFVILAVPATVSAATYQTYVGLKIESVNNPDAPSPTEWCVPVSTVMTIKDGDTELDTITTSSDTCPSGTIWSGLVALNPAQDYIILLRPCGGPDGFQFNGKCWYEATVGGISCTTACSNLNLTCTMDITHGNDNTSCDMCHHFHPTAGCLSDQHDGGIPRMEGTNCYYMPDGYTTSCGGTCPASWGPRLCECGDALSYNFTFTAPAE